MKNLTMKLTTGILLGLLLTTNVYARPEEVCKNHAQFVYVINKSRVAGVPKKVVQEKVLDVTKEQPYDDRLEMLLIIDVAYVSTESPQEVADKYYNNCLKEIEANND